MDRYELLKFVHIGAAIVWIGGAFVLQLVAARTIVSGDPLRLVTPESKRIGNQIEAEGLESLVAKPGV